VSAVQSRPCPPFFQQVAHQSISFEVSLCPNLCPTQAHSSAFQRTSGVRSVTTPSFQIQLESALVTGPVVFFGSPVWLVPRALTGSARDATGHPRCNTAPRPPCPRTALCYLRAWTKARPFSRPATASSSAERTTHGAIASTSRAAWRSFSGAPTQAAEKTVAATLALDSRANSP